ncbi:MAG: dTDP-4-dehydrorhamnose reductase [Syntrophorhabdales bacterium]|jgi:dTDP-4-dehydrorhamnose reductase
MKILIAGKNGQLGREFAKALAAPEFEVEAPDEEKLDVTNADAVTTIIAGCRPDVVLNCAAYNLVDDAEWDPGPAFAINATGVGNLAAACRETGALLVHYGTDYVFDGQKGAPYTEEDAPRPLNNYGRSKLAGEQILREALSRFLLLRVSWVFGEGKQNFLHKLLQWADGGGVLRVVDDQISIPTPTWDIVRLTLLAMHAGLNGIYHMTPSGYASRFEVARYFLTKMGVTNTLIPVSTDYFPSPAKRPRFSALSNEKLAVTLGAGIPGWTSGVDRYVVNLKQTVFTANE